MISHSKPTLGIEEENEVLSVIRSGNICYGDKVREFEKEFELYLGRKHAIAVNSGLSALHLALYSTLGIKFEPNVILPSYTCDALLQAISYINGQAIVIDVDKNGCSDYLDFCRNFQEGDSFLMPHSPNGYPVNMNMFKKFESTVIIEDCATAIGGKANGKKVGTFGYISVFSFHATKMMTTGSGGMIVTDDSNIAERIKDMRDYTGHWNFKKRFNYKMTDISAALGIVQLRKLGGFIEERKYLFRLYREMLKDCPVYLPTYNEESSCYRFFVQLIEKQKRDEVINEMKRKGISCGVGVMNPIHRLLKMRDWRCRETSKLADKVISLPIYPSLSSNDVGFISETFRKCIEK